MGRTLWWWKAYLGYDGWCLYSFPVSFNAACRTLNVCIYTVYFMLHMSRSFHTHCPEHLSVTTIILISDFQWFDMVYRMGYADYCGFINQNERFDYRDGCDLWKEKLDYTITWIQAGLSINNPLSSSTLHRLARGYLHMDYLTFTERSLMQCKFCCKVASNYIVLRLNCHENIVGKGQFPELFNGYGTNFENGTSLIILE